MDSEEGGMLTNHAGEINHGPGRRLDRKTGWTGSGWGFSEPGEPHPVDPVILSNVPPPWQTADGSAPSSRLLKKAHNPLPTDTTWAPAGTPDGAERGERGEPGPD